MIRTLSLLSALVAAALAVLFNDPLLYAAAGVFLLVFVLVLVGARRRRRPTPARLPTTRPVGGETLEDLGILEVRPKAAPGTRPPAPVVESTLPEVTIPEDVLPSMPTRSIVRVKTAPPRQDPDVVTRDQEARATLNHLLHALLHATGAHTTGLLREETGQSRRYHIELIVSRNAFARADGVFVARTPFATAGDQAPVLHTIGGELTPASLRYYREELAIHRLLAVALTYQGTPYVLFADAMEDDLLATPRAQFLLTSTARFIEHVEAAAEGAPDPPPVVLASDAEETAADGDSGPRPRREIIAEEMDTDRQMALALVHLQADGEGDLDIHERALETALHATFGDARIERFGELTFGVFLRGPVEAVEERVGVGHAQLSEHLSHPVSIGAVYVSDRHDSPDVLRADATDALKESYETGAPVLVG